MDGWMHGGSEGYILWQGRRHKAAERGETNSEGVNGQCQFEQGERKRARQS